jgi:O-antigen/teichoic acid export membrane protein
MISDECRDDLFESPKIGCNLPHCHHELQAPRANYMRHIVLAACPEFVRSRWLRIESSPIAYRIVRGMVWLLVGAILARAPCLIASVWVARILGQVDFGQLGIIQNTVGMFGAFAAFGLGLTATKYIAEYRTKDLAKAGRIMALSGLAVMAPAAITSLLLFCWAPWLAEHTLNAPHLAPFLRIGTIMMFFTALNGSQMGVLAGLEQFRMLARLNVITSIVAAFLQVGMVYFGGLEAVVWGLVAAAFINWAVSHWILRIEAARAAVPWAYRDCIHEWPVLWKFSLPVTIIGMLSVPVTWACSAMIATQPQGFAQMGIFYAANQWRVAILFVPAAISAVVLPMLSNLRGQNADKRCNQVLWYNLLVNVAVASAVAVPLILLSPWIMAAYGESFREGYVVVILLAFVAVIYTVVNIVGQSLASEEKMWLGLAMTLVWAAAALIMTWSWRHNGALGLAAANLLAYGIYLILLVGYLLYRNRNEKVA